jgi:hypothetical protein
MGKFSNSNSYHHSVLSFVQNVIIIICLLTTFLPYLELQKFKEQRIERERIVHKISKENMKLERLLREQTTKATNREQDAKIAEQKAQKLEKEFKDFERRNSNLENAKESLQKKLDLCAQDRTSLSDEVKTTTTKVSEVARVESKLERCKHDNLDLNAMTKELRTELNTLEKELKEEMKLRKTAEAASAAQREMATKIKNSLLAMQQAEDKVDKDKARAQVLKRLAKAEKAANATKRKSDEGEEDEEDEEDEDETSSSDRKNRKNRKSSLDDDNEIDEEYDDLAHRKIVGDDDEIIITGSRAHAAEKRLRFEKKKSMKKERWTAGGLDKDLNGRLNVDKLRKMPKLTRAEGVQGTLKNDGTTTSSSADLAHARAMRDET